MNGLRAACICLALLGAALPQALASPFLDAANWLNGEWEGEGFKLRVDSRRAQASIDPGRPFQWQRFLVKDVSVEEIVFTIGAELFEAKRDADSIVLTSTTFRGERVLVRKATGLAE